eukprot:351505-Chlamydomonas_euryale.AAC.7
MDELLSRQNVLSNINTQVTWIYHPRPPRPATAASSCSAAALNENGPGRALGTGPQLIGLKYNEERRCTRPWQQPSGA